MDRIWFDDTIYDLYWPELANLSEQPVYKKEVWWDKTNATNDDVFGYNERYGHLKYSRNKITGRMRSDAATNFDEYHLAEDFATQPALNQTFIEPNTPMSRIKKDTTAPDFLADMYFNLTCVRPMPVHSIPSMKGHF